MGMWATREEALSELEGDLKPQARALQSAFGLLDSTIDRFASDDLPPPCRQAAGLCLAKARNLALGCYSLILDGLAQEAGALVRPLIESYELLTFFRREPTGFQLALEGNLPSAGEIAKKIDGKLKPIRDYFNTHASHLSFHPYSIQHLLDHATGEIRSTQGYSRDTVVRNGRLIFTLTSAVAAEGIRVLQDHIGDRANDLVEQAESCRIAGDEAFDIPRYLTSLNYEQAPT